jgi:hypothetical protein
MSDSILDQERKALVTSIQAIDAITETLHKKLREATLPKSLENPEGPRMDVADKIVVALASASALRVQVRDAFASFGVRPV